MHFPRFHSNTSWKVSHMDLTTANSARQGCRCSPWLVELGWPCAQRVQLGEQQELAWDETTHTVLMKTPVSTCAHGRQIDVNLRSMLCALPLLHMHGWCRTCTSQQQGIAGRRCKCSLLLVQWGRPCAQFVSQLSEQPELTRDEATHAVFV